MAEPSPQDIAEQAKQAQQNSWAQTASQQTPLHPMATGGSYAVPPTLPIQSANIQSSGKPKRLEVSMGRLSLLGITFSLMALGSFIFLGGFLLGIWFVGPVQAPIAARYVTEAPPLQQYAVPQQNAGVAPQPEDGFQRLGEQLGHATEREVSNAPIPNVPTFLAPLVSATRSAIGQQAGYKVQQQINRATKSSQPPSRPPYSMKAPESESQMPVTPFPSHQTFPGHHSSLPVITSQQMPPTPPANEALRSSSRGENENYTVQLGVYASKENAVALVNHLQALNFQSHIIQSKAPDGSVSYYVHSGHYKDYNTALEAASNFAPYNIPGAIIVKISKNNERTS